MKLLVILAFLASYNAALAYKAAVFEHYALTADTPRDTILKNLNEYRSYADKAKEQSANIVVFPEYGLTTIVQNPQEYAITVNNTDEIIKELRTIVVERQIYVVVNLIEKEELPNSQVKYYNTDLVFDRAGSIILKYRKINLFQEPNLTPGEANQTLTFTTDFGVTFGLFTGLDILYENPSQRVFENNTVTDIVFPTSWISIMPFMTPLSIQHGYALANGVNLLGANYNRPKESHGGSGIYLASGKIAETFISETSSSKPLIQDVAQISKRENRTECPTIVPYALPGQANKTDISDYVTKGDFAKDLYTYKRIDLTKDSSSYEICYNSFCCNFDIQVNVAETNTTSVYKLVAYDGPVSYIDYSNHVSLCALLVCESDSDSSCGARINGTTKFTKITVKANVTENQTYFRPVSVNYYLQPIVQTAYCFKNETNSSSFQFTTLKSQQELLAFGIIGKVAGSGSAAIHSWGLLFLVFYTFTKYFVF